jgi:hypothetical protein
VRPLSIDGKDRQNIVRLVSQILSDLLSNVLCIPIRCGNLFGQADKQNALAHILCVWYNALVNLKHVVEHNFCIASTSIAIATEN